MNPVRWWHWLPRFRWFIAGTVEQADEVPERLPSKAAILVGSMQQPKWLAFDCPCRTGHRILIPLHRAQNPHWRVLAEKPLTVAPSVDYRTPQKRCHYFIRGGWVLWS
jgi:hypothetical protein